VAQETIASELTGLIDQTLMSDCIFTGNAAIVVAMIL